MKNFLIRLRARYDVAIVGVVLIILIVGIALGIWGENGTHQNVGFLLIGASLAAITIPLVEYLQRPEKRNLLAHGLYVELADRVARCIHDYEQPWRFIQASPKDVPMPLQKLKKFTPNPPMIFPATAHQVAMLENDALQKLIQFYYQLAAWERDVDAAANPHDPAQKYVNGIGTLALRLQQTLAPGLEALRAFDSMIENAEALDATAMNAYNRYRKDHLPGTLRERVASMQSTDSRLGEMDGD